MRRKRRNHSASFKAKVAVAAVRGEKTLSELAQQYDMHPNQIQDWRGRLVGSTERLLERGTGRDHDTEHQLKELHAKIGQLTMERDFVRQARSLAVTHQCELLALLRSSAYHQPAPVSEQDLRATRLLDAAHLQYLFYGSRRLSDWLGERGVKANRKRVRRLMGLEALSPRPRTSRPDKGHKVWELYRKVTNRLKRDWQSVTL